MSPDDQKELEKLLDGATAALERAASCKGACTTNRHEDCGNA